jgi:AbiV family abortive infection protein
MGVNLEKMKKVGKFQAKFREAFEHCKWNIEQYIKDIKLLMEKGSYGHAYALSVICQEELEKLWTYYFVSIGAITKESYENKFQTPLSDHIYKLKGQLLSRKNRQIAEEVFLKLKKERDLLSDDEILKLLEKIPRLLLKYYDANFLAENIQFRKEKALYVDVRDGKVIGPKDIGKGDVEQMLLTIRNEYDGIVKTVEFINSMFENSPEF